MKLLARIGAGAGAAALFGTAALSPVCCLCVLSLVLLATSAGAVYLALAGHRKEEPPPEERPREDGEEEKDLSKHGAA